MCSAAKRLPHLYLDNQQKFHYLNQGNSPEIESVDDLECFDETTTALTMLGFTSKQQDDMFRILAAVLHLGNVTVEGSGTNDTESCFISVCFLIVSFKSKFKFFLFYRSNLKSPLPSPVMIKTTLKFTITN